MDSGVKNDPSALFEQLARRYIWWERPVQAMQRPIRIAAQVMNLGDYEDVLRLEDTVGRDYLRDTLRRAEAGQFNARSRAWWHYRLGLARPEELPPMPKRTLG